MLAAKTWKSKEMIISGGGFREFCPYEKKDVSLHPFSHVAGECVDCIIDCFLAWCMHVGLRIWRNW